MEKAKTRRSPRAAPERDREPLEQLRTYRDVTRRMTEAISAHTKARVAYDLTRDAFEDKKRSLLLDGIPGLPERANVEQREAALNRALNREVLALRVARERYRSAEAEMDTARASERFEREVLRFLVGDGHDERP